MKKFLYIALISIVLWSCGGSGGDTPPPPPVNNAPTVPSLVYPSNNLLCIDNVVAFQWNAATDSDGDAITYQIQVAKDNQFTQIVHTFSQSSTTKSITLEKGIAYYWRVKATDSKNASSDYSSTFQFYTEGEGETNYLPFTPVVVKPTLGEIVQGISATLEWTASDVDNDSLTFDVYFGTDNPPATKVSENQTPTTFDISLTASTEYFWQIVVKDDKGGQTNGQIWNFKTD